MSSVESASSVPSDDVIHIPPNPFMKNTHWEPSSEEIELIRKSWLTDDSQQEELGLDIYTLIFHQHPEIKLLFSQLQSQDEDIRENAAFRRQSGRFVRTLDYVVLHLDKMESIIDYLHYLGSTHAKMSYKTLPLPMWTAFKDAIELSMEYRIETSTEFVHVRESEKQRMHQAWQLLCELISRHMYNGFTDGILRKKMQAMAAAEGGFDHLNCIVDAKEKRELIEKAAPWIPSPEQVKLITDTWSDDLQTQKQLGIDIYSIIFDRHPLVQQLFPQVSKLSPEEVHSSEAFQAQAMRFVKVIDFTIKHLNSPDKMDKYLHDIGAAHVRFASRGFTPSMWSLFKDAIELAIEYRTVIGKENFSGLSLEQKQAAQVAWSNLSVMIVQRMRIGYLDAVQKPLMCDSSLLSVIPGANPFERATFNPDCWKTELELLRKCWNDDESSLLQFGMDIYSILFNRMPDVERLFSQDTGDIRENAGFRARGQQIAELLDHAVKNANDHNSLGKSARDVGATFVHVASRVFTPALWSILKESIDLAFEYRCETGHGAFGQLEEEQRNTVHNVWLKLSALTVKEMYEGFVCGLMSLNDKKHQEALEAKKSGEGDGDKVVLAANASEEEQLKTTTVTIPVEAQQKNSSAFQDATQKLAKAAVVQPNPFAKFLDWEPTKEEIEMITKSWSDDVHSLQELGLDFYAILFEKVPDSKALYPQLKLTNPDIRLEPCFLDQALKLGTMLDSTVKKLSNEVEMCAYLTAIGGEYGHLTESRAVLTSHLWVAFKEAIDLSVEFRCEMGRDKFACLHEMERKVLETVWAKFSAKIVGKIYEGFGEVLWKQAQSVVAFQSDYV